MTDHAQVANESVVTMDKPYTCDKRAVRLFCVDRPGDWPVIGLIDTGFCGFWRSDGTDGWNEHQEKIPDLVEVREKRRLEGWWLVIPKVSCPRLLQSRAAALSQARLLDADAVLDLSREYEVGEGME